jgi:hypothetical protein
LVLNVPKSRCKAYPALGINAKYVANPMAAQSIGQLAAQRSRANGRAQRGLIYY